MSNNNTAPFRIGQEVVALKDHSGLLFKKGDRFIISGVYGAECRCPFHWLVSVGILAPAPLCYCKRCDYMFKSHKEAMFRATCFAPIQYSDITASLASEAMKDKPEVDVVRELITEKTN